MVRNRSCPAVSQICNLIFLPSNSMVLILKSIPGKILTFQPNSTRVFQPKNSYRLWKWKWRWMHPRKTWTIRRFCPRPNHQWVKVWTSNRMFSPLFFLFPSKHWASKISHSNTTLNLTFSRTFLDFGSWNEKYFSWMIQGLKMLTELSKFGSKMSQSQLFSGIIS